MYKCAFSTVHHLFGRDMWYENHNLSSVGHTVSPFEPSRFIGNLAAVVGLVLVGGFFLDLAGKGLGYQPHILCTLLGSAVTVAHGIGVLLTSVGIIVYVASMLKSQAGLGLAVGGLMLAVLPMMMPHYLGVICPA